MVLHRTWDASRRDVCMSVVREQVGRLLVVRLLRLPQR